MVHRKTAVIHGNLFGEHAGQLAKKCVLHFNWVGKARVVFGHGILFITRVCASMEIFVEKG